MQIAKTTYAGGYNVILNVHALYEHLGTDPLDIKEMLYGCIREAVVQETKPEFNRGIIEACEALLKGEPTEYKQETDHENDA